MIPAYFWEQGEVLKCNSRYIFVIAGKQGGKTTLGAHWLKRQMDIANEQRIVEDFLIAAPTYKILFQATLRVFLREFPFFRKFFNEQKQVIDSPWGSIFVRSLDDPDSIEGMTLKAIWVDEGDAIKERAWFNLQDRVRIKEGRILLTTNPYGKRWLYELEKKLKEKPNPDYRIFRWSSYKNPSFSILEYQRAKQELSKEEFERRYKGEFVETTGLVHPLNENNFKKELLPLSDFREFIGGIDFGYTNPTAIEILGLTYDGEVWVVDEFYKEKLLISDILVKTKELQEKWNVSVFYADSSRPDYIKTLNDMGIPTLPAIKDIVYGIDKVNSYLKNERLFVISHISPNLIEESKLYCYREDVISDKPKDEFNHAWDAVRYALATHFVYKTEKPVKKDLPEDNIWYTIKKRIEEKKEETEFDWEDVY